MSEWKRDASAGDTTGWAHLDARLRRAEALIAELTTRAPLSNASIGEGGLRVYGGGSVTVTDGGGVTVAEGGGVTIEDGGNLSVDGDALVAGTLRSADFDGDLVTGSAGTKGWAFDRAHAAIGELFLRPGSIANESLSNPVIPEVRMANATGFELTTSLAEKASLDVTVPAGCTRLLAKADGFIYAVNPNQTGGSDGQGGDAISCRTDVGGGFSAWMPEGVSGWNGFSTQTSSLAVLLDGLTPGSTVHLAQRGMSNYQTMPANPTNRAYLSAMLIWLR